MSSNICLSIKEIEAITGKRQPASQLKILLERGFYRAYRSDGTGAVILERAHYESVCCGGFNDKQRPKVRRLRNEAAL